MTLGVNMTAVARVVGEYRGVSSPIISQDLARLETAIDFGEGSTWGTYADRLYAGTRTISASSSENLDLAGGLTDVLGNTLTFLQVTGVLIKAAAGNTNNVVVGGAGSNTWTGPFGAADNTLTIPPGGSVLLMAQGGEGAWSVTAGTGDILKVANSGSGSSVSYDIVIWGASSDRLDLAYGATDVWDFAAGSYRQDFTTRTAIADDLRWSFSRASTGYARTVAGSLVAFASGAPRITDKGLLIEEQRTNAFLRSHDLGNPAWTKSGASIVTGAAGSPAPGILLDKLVENSSNSTHLLSQVVTASNGAWTVSAVGTAGERTAVLLEMSDGTNTVSAVVNLGAGTIAAPGVSGVWTSASAAMETLGDGRYRMSLTATKAAGTQITGRLYLSDGSNITYLGDGSSGAYVGLLQLEAGAFPTSYIPTTSSAATRLADVALETYALDAAGSLYAEAVVPSAAAVAASAGLIGSQGAAYLIYTGTGAVKTYNGSSAAEVSTTLTPGATVKGAVAWSGATRTIAADGVSPVDDANTIGAAGAGLDFGRIASSIPLNGYLRKAMAFPRRLSSAELQALTT